MGTTALVVELLVVGSGAGAWLSLTILTVLGYKWLPEQLSLDPVILLFLLPLLYVLGLVVDRVADAVLGRYAQKMRRRDFPAKEDFQAARVQVSEKPAAWAMFEYGRTRMRVCRGWVINSGLILIIGNFFVWFRLPSDVPRLAVSLLGSVIAGGIALGCAYAWRDLVESEVVALAGWVQRSRPTS